MSNFPIQNKLNVSILLLCFVGLLTAASWPLFRSGYVHELVADLHSQGSSTNTETSQRDSKLALLLKFIAAHNELGDDLRGASGSRMRSETQSLAARQSSNDTSVVTVKGLLRFSDGPIAQTTENWIRAANSTGFWAYGTMADLKTGAYELNLPPRLQCQLAVSWSTEFGFHVLDQPGGPPDSITNIPELLVVGDTNMEHDIILPTVWLNGTIQDDTGAPISNGTFSAMQFIPEYEHVGCQPWPGPSFAYMYAPTDSQGHFGFRALRGNYSSVRVVDQSPGTLHIATMLPGFNLIGNATMTFVITTGYLLEGKVTDLDPASELARGLVVTGTPVSVPPSPNVYELNMCGFIPTSTVDSQGRYKLAVLPGVWSLSLIYGSPQSIRALSVSLTVDKNLTYDFAGRLYSWQGNIVDDVDGTTLVPQSTIRLSAPWLNQAQPLEINIETGHFSIPLFTGVYQLVEVVPLSQPNDSSAPWYPTRLPDLVLERDTVSVLKLKRSSTVSGSCRVKGAGLSNDTKVVVMAVPVGTDPPRAPLTFTSAMSDVDASGRYKLFVAPGRYDLWAVVTLRNSPYCGSMVDSNYYPAFYQLKKLASNRKITKGTFKISFTLYTVLWTSKITGIYGKPLNGTNLYASLKTSTNTLGSICGVSNSTGAISLRILPGLYKQVGLIPSPELRTKGFGPTWLPDQYLFRSSNSKFTLKRASQIRGVVTFRDKTPVESFSIIFAVRSTPPSADLGDWVCLGHCFVMQPLPYQPPIMNDTTPVNVAGLFTGKITSGTYDVDIVYDASWPSQGRIRLFWGYKVGLKPLVWMNVTVPSFKWQASIVDSRRQPVQDATLQTKFVSLLGVQPGNAAFLYGSDRTGANGTLVIPRAAKGRYNCLFAAQQPAENTNYSVKLLGSPKVIKDVNATYILPDLVTVSGTLRNSDGSPASNGSVVTMEVSGCVTGLIGSPMTFTDAQGKYELQVSPNVPYKVSVSYASPTFTRFQYIVLANNTVFRKNVTKDLTVPSAVWRATVRDESGKPVPNVSVWFSGLIYRTMEILSGSITAMTDSNGQFSARILKGMYVNLQLVPPLPWLNLRLGNVTITHDIEAEYVLKS